jgi:HEAT repeat protein
MASSSLDHLRTFLDHLDGDDRSHQLAFFQGILEAGPDAIAELDGRLPGSRAPRALRRLTMEASFYFPWPGWVRIHQRVLRYEADHEIFVTGVRALGRIGTEPALEALRELNAMRQGEAFTETLAEVLSQTDPREAFNHYFSRLLQGSANAGVANEAAQRLLQLVDGGSIEALRTLAQHPDLLVFRHAIVLLAHVFTKEAAEALRAVFLESHLEVLGDRGLKEAMAAFRTLPPAAAAEAAGAALDALDSAPRKGGDPGGLLSGFYLEVLGATQEGKASQLGSLLAQAAEAMHLRSRRLGFAVDAAAEGLVEMVAKGQIAGPAVLDLLVESYREQTGREGVARAIARLVPAQAQEIHRLILDGPDGAQRAAAVEILGARAEAALQPVLLQACRDPLADIADRARFFLGRLPDAEDIASGLLRAQAPADFQLGLQLVSEHRFRGLVPDLLVLLKAATREDLVLQLVEALGAVASDQAIEPLLEMLHSGQSPRLQTAIAQALRAMGSLKAARTLCAKADEIKLCALHVIAVEALAAAHRGTGGPLPLDAGPLLRDQARAGWNDRNPWPSRLRLVLALQSIGLEAPEVWRDLAGLVEEALAEKRSPTAWSTEELHAVQAAAREFARRAGP